MYTIYNNMHEDVSALCTFAFNGIKNVCLTGGILQVNDC